MIRPLPATPGGAAPDAWARAVSGLSPPVRRRAVAASCGLAILISTYLLIGVIGHDPWKQDEPYVFGIILELMRSGDWVVPTLAGEPFMEKPPLYYLLAAACARLAAPLLAMHDAARLASAMCVGITLVCTARAARLVWGRGASMATCLLVAGCLGLVLPARQMLTDLALLALRRALTPLQRRFRSVAIATTGAFVGVLIAAASARETYALPLLVPLSVLAAGAVRLRDERLDRVLASIGAIGWGLATLWLVAIWATHAHPGEIPGSLQVARLIPTTDPLPQSAAIWWAAINALLVVGTAALLFGRPAGIPR